MSRNEIRALIAAAAALGLSMTPADAARLVEPTGYAEMRQLVEAHPEIDRAIFPGLSAAPLLMGGKKAGLKPQDVFNASTWSGTGAARTITTGIDSSEGSLIWIKNRSDNAAHVLFDSLRGTNVALSSSDASNETLYSASLTSYLSDGYNLGSHLYVNSTSKNFVGWQFRQAERFFKIASYTGNGAFRQIDHDIGVEPGLIFVKRRNQGAGSATSDWAVYHRSAPATVYAVLNSTAAFSSSASIWGGVAPTDAQFSVFNDVRTNQNGAGFIGYVFGHDPSPDGLIQCGQYFGNGVPEGPNIDLGWTPQFILIKRANNIGNWVILDTKRGIFAGSDPFLHPNSAASEAVSNYVNLSPTGFNIVANAAEVNASGGQFIYMAIREAA